MKLNHIIERVSISIINTDYNLNLDFTAAIVNEKSISCAKNEASGDYNTTRELEEKKIISSQSKLKV